MGVGDSEEPGYTGVRNSDRGGCQLALRCAVSGVVTVVGNYDCLEGRSLNLGPGIYSVLIITQSVLGGS